MLFLIWLLQIFGQILWRAGSYAYRRTPFTSRSSSPQELKLPVLMYLLHLPRESRLENYILQIIWKTNVTTGQAHFLELWGSWKLFTRWMSFLAHLSPTPRKSAWTFHYTVPSCQLFKYLKTKPVWVYETVYSGFGIGTGVSYHTLLYYQLVNLSFSSKCIHVTALPIVFFY